MEKLNPLLLPLPFSYVLESKSPRNKRGRPALDKTIKFSAQPKSIIISQLLNEKTVRSNTYQQNLTQLENNSPETETSPPSTDQSLQNGTDVAGEEKDPKKTNSHMKDRLHYCDYPNCTYYCKLSCNLIKHKRTHSAEKPYLCDQCTFRSNFVNSLKVHKRTHTLERPYVCKHCTYRCNSSSNLKKHCLHRHPEISKT